MSKLKQILNSVYMYLYLEYYKYKLRTDTRYMLKEALEHKQDMRDK